MSLDRKPVARALISVYDKTGLLEFAASLVANRVEIVSTGSTAATIANAGLPVTTVEEITGFPECLGGRVKTLHPAIHAGILADLRLEHQRQQLENLGISAFDLVVCNLYPFEETVASCGGLTYSKEQVDTCVEQIDIGGPTMVRAAAKNHPSVAVLTDPDSYGWASEEIKAGGFTLAQRRVLAAKAFSHTARYDAAVSQWFTYFETENMYEVPKTVLPQEDASKTVKLSDETLLTSVKPNAPAGLTQSWALSHTLRYGENPHQKAGVYREVQVGGDVAAGMGIAGAIQLHGKEMSYNNYTDADAALRAAYDFTQPCVAVIKHANPCGLAVADAIALAHQKAHACDPVSAFGGVIAANREVDAQMASQVAQVFTEVVVAPSFSEQALEILTKKKNVRLLTVAGLGYGGAEFKQISGGLLIHSRDQIDQVGDNPNNWTLVAGAEADKKTLADLEFSWRAIRSVRSNAILLAKDGATVGIGMGQVNRVDSARLAVQRANTLSPKVSCDSGELFGVGGANSGDIVAADPERRAHGAVGASDAFFPFADGLEILTTAGVRAIVQPGGSMRDEEVIEAAQKAGVTMYFTGVRHFTH